MITSRTTKNSTNTVKGKNNIRIAVFLETRTSRRFINLRMALPSSRTQDISNPSRSVAHRITVSVSISASSYENMRILILSTVRSNLEELNPPISRQMPPFPNSPSDQKYQRSNKPQPTATDARSEPQFFRNHHNYDRGDNPRNSHGIRLRPVSELRMSTARCSTKMFR
jgi:hypothetical protein